MPNLPSRSTLVLQAALQLLLPLVRLLLRHGVAYPAFVTALKPVFLKAAQQELQGQNRAMSDSAVSLLSGLHRRDVRTLSSNTAEPVQDFRAPMNMAMQVVATWMSEPLYTDPQGKPRLLKRSDADGFDALVTGISSDIRPRAVLEELLRLGVVEDTVEGLMLREAGFAPRQGFAEMAHLLQANAHDHLAAGCQNLEGSANFLEQSVFVDEITLASANRLHAVAASAWRQAFKTVMKEAAARYEDDKQNASIDDRIHRARFGGYFYTEPENKHAAAPSTEKKL